MGLGGGGNFTLKVDVFDLVNKVMNAVLSLFLFFLYLTCVVGLPPSLWYHVLILLGRRKCKENELEGHALKTLQENQNYMG